MTPTTAAVATLITLLALATIVWIVSVRLRNASIVDIGWGPAFAVVAWLNIAWFGTFQSRPLLLAVLVTIWGVRLGVHIYLRNRGHGEDPRYVSIRGRVGPTFWWSSLFIVFWLQAILVWLIAMPVFIVATHPGHGLWTVADIAGLIVFAGGLLFESIGDEQLRRFKANPANRGRVLDTGLWRYTRHPNYFGDALLWWGIYFLSTSSPYGFLTVLSPALMTFLLVRVSGVALLERNLKTSKPEYAGYIARTSSFVPWPPRSR